VRRKPTGTDAGRELEIAAVSPVSGGVPFVAVRPFSTGRFSGYSKGYILEGAAVKGFCLWQNCRDLIVIIGAEAKHFVSILNYT
jgi:hypothetical protein